MRRSTRLMATHQNRKDNPVSYCRRMPLANRRLSFCGRHHNEIPRCSRTRHEDKDVPYRITVYMVSIGGQTDAVQWGMKDAWKTRTGYNIRQAKRCSSRNDCTSKTGS